MVVQRILIGLALVLFLAQTTLVLQDPGFVGFFESANLNAATRLMFLDLVIALALIAAWMWKDAARSGHVVLPYLVVTLLLGIAGPLLYLLRRSWGLDGETAVRKSATRPTGARMS